MRQFQTLLRVGLHFTVAIGLFSALASSLAAQDTHGARRLRAAPPPSAPPLARPLADPSREFQGLYVRSESRSSQALDGQDQSHATASDLVYDPPGFTGNADGFRSMLSRIFIATILVLIACCATIWLAKRYLGLTQGKQATQGSLRLLATLPVSRRGCVQLVQAEGTKLVVAIDGGALKSVIPLSEPFTQSLFDAIDDQQPAESTKLDAKHP